MGRASNVVVLAAVLFLFSACAGTPHTGGEEYIKPHEKGSDYSRKELQKVDVFVAPQAQPRVYREVAVIPFRAQEELAGTVITEAFTAKLLETYKYPLTEASRVEKVLGEQAAGGEEFDDISLAVSAGQALGVEGVVVGAVPEYGLRVVDGKELPAIGISVRMIDVSGGTVVWSVGHSGVSSPATSLTSFSDTLLGLSVARLERAWIAVGDTLAAGAPVPQVVSHEGGLRGGQIEILTDPAFTSYRFFRSRSEDGFYEDAGSIRNSGPQVVFSDKGLHDLETYFYKVVGVVRNGLSSPAAGLFEIDTAGPPGGVEGFSAQSEIIRKVPLSWQPLHDPYVKGYKIFRRTGDEKWSAVKKLGKANASDFTDTRLGDGVTYEYRIIAYNKAGVEGPPSLTTATTKGPPSSVTSLQAGSASPRQVPLSWPPVEEGEVKGYVIYRADDEGGPYWMIKKVKGWDVGEYVDRGSGGFWRRDAHLKDETRYYYLIRAVNVVDVESVDSPVAAAVTKATPVPVRALQAGQLGIQEATLRWEPNPEGDIDRYEVFRGEKEGSVRKKVADLPPDQPHFTDKDLKNGRIYYYRVRAVDSDGLVGKSSPSVFSETKAVPSRPTGLTAVEDNGSVILTWHENPEQDISHYLVVKRGFLSSETIGTSEKPPFIYEPEKGGTLRLRVRAVDADALESVDSKEFTIKVPKKK